MAQGQEKGSVVLDGKSYSFFRLLERIPLTHNTAVYRFALPHPDDVLGLPIGQHLFLSAEIDGKRVTRQYTPVSGDADLGYFDLVIKVYPGGKMSTHVDRMAPGDEIAVKGPKGRFKYVRGMADALGMIAGGTGITPMLQIITAVLEDPEDTTKLNLIFANVNYEDILLKDDLDSLAATYPDQFSVYYVLNNPPSPEWDGGVGYVSADMIQAWLPPASPATRMLLCGPKPMVKAMKSIAADLGFATDGKQVFAF
ncbi:NADH-cytochrome b5 reductase 1 [Thecamonas trahens ATCC 50062]|uniref:NADH-cytochrome b5 reductase n=1 Tax=Thecamonas trahens ATCC 50062 TaxID=461836 RepID=A0A0L0D8B0_THETB|nr:NADH-cytochrome b5 reductase 1 [Thecamonas trahens ATCC 50062]KNC48316.1 NADH-cytochrome b5 reductase 1 [Thecamonas trahens ATCC 50062]|eukprot:XP_013758883.1 NADH-cytochrome b5 reductase 1 [Thecamonas trahens ATCC 50062]